MKLPASRSLLQGTVCRGTLRQGTPDPLERRVVVDVAVGEPEAVVLAEPAVAGLSLEHVEVADEAGPGVQLPMARPARAAVPGDRKLEFSQVVPSR